MFHTSCLIHWILLCEYEIATNSVVLANFSQGTRRKIGGTKRKNGANVNGIGKQSEVKAAAIAQINKVFCPECQGSGMIINGDGVEHANFNLSEVCCHMIKPNKECSNLNTLSLFFLFSMDVYLGEFYMHYFVQINESRIVSGQSSFGIYFVLFVFLQMFKFKIKASDARREWMKSPEVLHNCSTGFHFPSQSEAMIQVLNISACSFI